MVVVVAGAAGRLSRFGTSGQHMKEGGDSFTALSTPKRPRHRYRYRRCINSAILVLTFCFFFVVWSVHSCCFFFYDSADSAATATVASDTDTMATNMRDACGEKSTQSIFLPYIYDFHTDEVPLLHATINGVAIEMPVDTGSTGLLIGAPLLPDVDPSEGVPAHHFLTSSSILYVGRLVPLTVEFSGRKAGSRAVARVTALVVDQSWVCPWYVPDRDTFACPVGKGGERARPRDTSRIMYMGVGFARNMPDSGQPDAVPSRNPFLNIVEVDGERTAARMKAGFIISTRGVEIGLTDQNVRGFAFTKLEPGVTHGEDARDWAMVRTNFSVDGQRGSFGYGLVDTGISQMYIRAEEGVSIPTVWLPNPNPNGTAKEVERVRPGTRINIDFVSPAGEKVLDYSIVVGESSAMAPTSVRPARRTLTPFLNTGRNFLWGYSIAFDAVDGRFGFRAVDDSTTANSIRSLLA